MLLASEKTPALSAASDMEAKRQETSLRERTNARAKYASSTVARPPTKQELQRCVVYVEAGVSMPSDWLNTVLGKHGGRVARVLHEANFFIVRNPWEPSEQAVTWTALLSGSWVISPACFMGKTGASLKYKPAVCMKRAVYISAAFRAENPMHWRVLLEVLSSLATLTRWTLIHTAPKWAEARARAEQQKHPSEVVGLVGSAEVQQPKLHLFTASSCLKFLASIDTARGSIGLGNM